MLIHYFLASLKPLERFAPPPMGVEEFLAMAEECLSGHVLADLRRLAQCLAVDRARRNYFCSEPATDFRLISDNLGDPSLRWVGDKFPSVVWQVYWQQLKTKSHAQFLRIYATEAGNFYGRLAMSLAMSDGFSETEIKRDFRSSDAISLELDWQLPDQVLSKLDWRDPESLECFFFTTLWNLADEISCHDQHSADQIFVYFIKLVLCERYSSFNENRGREILQQLVTRAVQGAVR